MARTSSSHTASLKLQASLSGGRGDDMLACSSHVVRLLSLSIASSNSGKAAGPGDNLRCICHLGGLSMSMIVLGLIDIITDKVTFARAPNNRRIREPHGRIGVLRQSARNDSCDGAYHFRRHGWGVGCLSLLFLIRQFHALRRRRWKRRSGRRDLGQRICLLEPCCTLQVTVKPVSRARGCSFSSRNAQSSPQGHSADDTH